jgi:hypothetical protein
LIIIYMFSLMKNSTDINIDTFPSKAQLQQDQQPQLPKQPQQPRDQQPRREVFSEFSVRILLNLRVTQT